MTQRQVRLESRWYDDDALQAELGPEASLERLAELRNDRAKFLKERYWVDGGYVRAVSTANPHPRYDWASIGGRWASNFANPPPWELPVETSPCTRCDGNGEGEFSYPVFFEDVLETERIKTIPEVIRVIEWSEGCCPWALVDLHGIWHGPEGGCGYGVPEEKDRKKTVENVVLKYLREAPEGAKVLVADAHYA